MQIIDITGATGSGPYDIYICDITLTYCYLVASSITIPPTYSVTLPIELEGVFQVGVKLIDSLGCEAIQVYSCPILPVTPTITPTMTPTMIVECNCLTFDNISFDAGSSVTNFSTNAEGRLTFGSMDQTKTARITCREQIYEANISETLVTDIYMGWSPSTKQKVKLQYLAVTENKLLTKIYITVAI
jgi:hypothetical protein